ncbi:MAG: hypothetical protein ABF990_07955 [Acetobacter sp.]|uniref:OmpA family protein n=1 Tax=Acetobacter sp. TaxID=440 RepID=UPI0039E7868A
MHKLFFFSRRVSLLCGAVILSMATAQAQVATSSQALDHLQGTPSTPPPATPAAGKPQQGATQPSPTRRRAPAHARTTPASIAPHPADAGPNAAPSPTAAAPTQGRSPQGAGNAAQDNTGLATPGQAKPGQTIQGQNIAGQAAPGQATQSPAASNAGAAKTAAQPAGSPPTGSPPTGSQPSGGQPTDSQKTAPVSGTQPRRAAPLPTIPNAPPAEPHLTPAPPDVEIHPFPIPEQPSVELKAQGTVSTVPGGVRLTFAPGSAALNPETHQAILAFGQRLSDKPHIRAMIDAYSSGAPDDPSLPRRMALARGLAARSVLMNGGTPSTRIYLRVIGLPPQAKPDETQDYITIYESDVVP